MKIFPAPVVLVSFFSASPFHVLPSGNISIPPCLLCISKRRDDRHASHDKKLHMPILFPFIVPPDFLSLLRKLFSPLYLVPFSLLLSNDCWPYSRGGTFQDLPLITEPQSIAIVSHFSSEIPTVLSPPYILKG